MRGWAKRAGSRNTAKALALTFDNRSRAEILRFAGTSKRATGFEPATFSLEGRRQLPIKARYKRVSSDAAVVEVRQRYQLIGDLGRHCVFSLVRHLEEVLGAGEPLLSPWPLAGGTI